MSPEDRATLDMEVERFKVYYEEASEQVRIDFRRRHDRAWAVICRCRPIWTRLDEVKKELAETRGNRWRLIVSGLLIAGGFLYSWVIPHLPENGLADTLGTALALWAAGYFIVLKWTEHTLIGDRNSLQMREADYLCEWQSAGAYSTEFWGERERNREENELISVKPPLSESEKTKLETAIRLNSQVLKHRTRHAIFLSASGTREERRLGVDGGGLKFYLENNHW
jgi:hypothetical protein